MVEDLDQALVGNIADRAGFNPGIGRQESIVDDAADVARNLRGADLVVDVVDDAAGVRGPWLRKSGTHGVACCSS